MSSTKSGLFSICVFVFAITLGNCYVAGHDRSSSYPYISGDTFRAYSDFIYDETQRSFSPSNVKKGNTVFVKTDLLQEFFSAVHPNIPQPYILISHNSDYPIPGNFVNFLDDPKIIAWFGQNVENYHHPKLYPIPIGIANKMWSHGNVQIWNTMRPQASSFPKDILLYLNFNISTKPDERSFVYNLFSNKPWCRVSQPKDYSSYLSDLGHTKFVLSPRGNGLDCHRTWEALMMGAIPIVKTSASDSLYVDLPVLVIDDWNVVTKEFLDRVYIYMMLMNYNTDKLFADYWFRLINSFK